jgi:hypothetical protein
MSNKITTTTPPIKENMEQGWPFKKEAKHIGVILAEYAQSNEPFAMCVRTLLASEEKQAEKGDVA